MAALPPVIRIGRARITSGLDRHARLDLTAHRAEFGDLPMLTAADLLRITSQVDLRGRGGAAFPVARKMRAVLTSMAGGKRRAVVVVNATEGEPGSAKDKMLLCRSPHLVLDGALARGQGAGRPGDHRRRGRRQPACAVRQRRGGRRQRPAADDADRVGAGTVRLR